MRKKVLVLTLACCMFTAVLAGCGKSKEEEDPGGVTPQVVTDPEPETDTDEPENSDETDNQEEEVSSNLSEEAAYVRETIAGLAINGEGFDAETAEISEYREPVTLVRSLFDALEEEEQAILEEDGTLELLLMAEARTLNLWIRDTPLDAVEDGGVTWLMEERYDELAEALGEETVNELVPLFESKFLAYNDLIPQFQEEKRINLEAGQRVDEAILSMDVNDAGAVAEVAEMYDALTSIQQAYVEHYYILREALGMPENALDRVIYTGTRSSVYGLGDQWLVPEEWKSVTDQMQEWYPSAQPTMVWIVGSLSGMGCNLEFLPADDVDTAALAEQYIYFSEPTRENHLSHEEYFNYFDENGIQVYLQVEPGFADVDTLIDLVLAQYGDHPCVVGVGVDVEWYHGVTEDAGLPISDALAEQWDRHIKDINPEYRLFLKHYNIRYLPPSYRSDILFVNDSQGFGSAIGDVLGLYDEDLDDVLGFMPEFKRFADAFPDNDVLYQIGYAVDETWFYTMEDPVVLSLGQRLAEVTGQNCGIIWVDFTIKDPMTFPWTMSTEDKVKAVNRLLRYLNPEEGGGAVGTRLSGVSSDPATARDFIFVKKVREIVDSLTEEELGMLDPERLGYLEWAESVAED
ncbi:MAG: hypothetical protein HDR21_06540 [Lachnospiraceae bacterium]|nr:hypothetical protein [Lachnospiraceae bacterium]